jgi:hypothetical protein
MSRYLVERGSWPDVYYDVVNEEGQSLGSRFLNINDAYGAYRGDIRFAGSDADLPKVVSKQQAPVEGNQAELAARNQPNPALFVVPTSDGNFFVNERLGPSASSNIDFGNADVIKYKYPHLSAEIDRALNTYDISYDPESKFWLTTDGYGRQRGAAVSEQAAREQLQGLNPNATVKQRSNAAGTGTDNTGTNINTNTGTNTNTNTTSTSFEDLKNQLATLQSEYDTLVERARRQRSDSTGGIVGGGVVDDGSSLNPGQTSGDSSGIGTTGKVYGPDGTEYSSAAAALAAGVMDFTFARPQFGPGLIASADTLGSQFLMPKANTGNANPGANIANQNIQLFEIGAPKVALPNQIPNPFRV